MPDTAELAVDPGLYEADEHLWIADQVAALRSGQLHRLDRAHLAEFLEDLARRDKRELKSRLTVLLTHLLKVRMQPERLTRSRGVTILRQQWEIEEFVNDLPSLRHEASEMLAVAYPKAVRAAARETGLPVAGFPREAPWTLGEALTFDPPEPEPRATRSR